MDMETETLQLQQHISKVDHQNAKLTEVSELNLFMLLSNMIWITVHILGDVTSNQCKCFVDSWKREGFAKWNYRKIE